LFITIGVPATIAFYWEGITIIVSAIWHTIINNPAVQDLIAQMFLDKAKEYIIANVTYLIVGVLLNVLPFKINGHKAFWIIYGILLLVLNGIIAAL